MSETSIDVSRRMRAVRSRGTACELAFEAALKRLRLAYVCQFSIMNCNVDFALPRYRVAIFIDGDFWHGRLLLQKGRRALLKSFKSSARDFWIAKISRNVERDRRQTSRLRRHGWSVLRCWEKEILRDPNTAIEEIKRRLKKRRRPLQPV